MQTCEGGLIAQLCAEVEKGRLVFVRESPKFVLGVKASQSKKPQEMAYR